MCWKFIVECGSVFSAFADQIYDHPTTITQLNMPDRKSCRFPASQTAADQKRPVTPCPASPSTSPTDICGYREFHILVSRVVDVRKTRGVPSVSRAGGPMVGANSMGVGSGGFTQRSEGEMAGSDLIRQRVVRSGGAVRQLGALLSLVPAPVPGSAAAPARPSPRKDMVV